MSQECSNTRLFEAHWDRRGKIRTLFPIEEATVHNNPEHGILDMQEDHLGGLVGVIQASSPIAAARNAHEHWLCINMDMKGCKHMKSEYPSPIKQGTAK